MPKSLAHLFKYLSAMLKRPPNPLEVSCVCVYDDVCWEPVPPWLLRYILSAISPAFITTLCLSVLSDTLPADACWSNSLEACDMARPMNALCDCDCDDEKEPLVNSLSACRAAALPMPLDVASGVSELGEKAEEE